VKKATTNFIGQHMAFVNDMSLNTLPPLAFSIEVLFLKNFICETANQE